MSDKNDTRIPSLTWQAIEIKKEPGTFILVRQSKKSTSKKLSFDVLGRLQLDWRWKPGAFGKEFRITPHDKSMDLSGICIK